MSNQGWQEIAVANEPNLNFVQAGPLGLFNQGGEVERLFEQMMPIAWLSPMTWGWPLWSGFTDTLENIRVPQCDLIDRDKDILVCVELPGVDKDDVDVSVSNATLTIKGTVRRASPEHKKEYFRCEIAHGNFSRSLTIPSGVDSSGITANLKDGILEVFLPKLDAEQPQLIEVK